MKCPLCRSVDFYIKDPEDEYETYEFKLKNGQVAFRSEYETAAAPEVQDQTEAFCNKCSWHGKLKDLIE